VLEVQQNSVRVRFQTVTIIASVARFTLRCGRIMSPRFAWRVGAMVGWACGGLPGREQGRARTHLAIAFPDKDPRWIARTARRSFRHFGATVFWALATLHIDQQRLRRGVMLEGATHIKELARACRNRHGTMCFTGHFGNWELLARLGSIFCTLTVIGRRLRDPGLDALVVEMRSAGTNHTIYTDQGARPALRALREGRAVSVLVDQDIPALDSVFVPWFGHPASTPVGPAQLAIATRSAILPMFLFRNANRWVIHCGPRWQWPEQTDRLAAATELTAWITAYEEHLVRRYPEQWVWWHKRWRTKEKSAVSETGSRPT